MRFVTRAYSGILLSEDGSQETWYDATRGIRLTQPIETDLPEEHFFGWVDRQHFISELPLQWAQGRQAWKDAPMTRPR